MSSPGEPAAELTQSEAMTGRRLRTRGALLRAGRRVIETRGYHATRVADIAAGAGVAVGTFYTYFASKESLFRDLLVAVEDEVYGELVDHRFGPDTPQARIYETNRLYLLAFERNAPFWAAIAESALTDADPRAVLAERRRYYRIRTERGLARWQERGLIGADVDIAVAAEMLGAMTERCAYLWFVFGEAVDPEEGARRMTEVWLRALHIPPA